MTTAPRDAASAWTRADTGAFLAILGLALALRWLFFAGFAGNDEVTYLGAAVGIVDGHWAASNYVGALRYGVNIPMAAGIAMLGLSEGAASAWGLLCSLAEIGVVYLAAQQLWGRRAAVFAALLMALLPLHWHEATRMLADPPLSLFVTLTFFLTWQAERREAARWYLAAGLALGCAYWVKDAVFYVTGMSLVLYGLLCWRWHRRWLWMALGAALPILLNMVLMQIVNGNWLHLIAVSKKSLGIVATTSPTLYLKYLLLDVRHFWLLAYLALGGGWLLLRQGRAAGRPAAIYAIWAVGMVMILSALPLRQPNYLLLVAAPLALFGGLLLARLRPSVAAPLLGLVVMGSVLLGVMQQQSLHAFTANSRAAVAFADAHPDAQIYGPTGAYRADLFAAHLGRRPADRPAMRTLAKADEALLKQGAGAELAYLIEDPQTQAWGDRTDADWPRRLATGCLAAPTLMTPAALGSGQPVVDALIAVAEHLPSSLGQRVSEKLRQTLRPEPARVYRVLPSCAPVQSANS